MAKTARKRKTLKQVDNDRLLSAFGSRLKKLRLENGYTLRQFSAKMSISLATLRSIESGTLEANLSMIDTIVRALHISHKKLLDFDLDTD